MSKEARIRLRVKRQKIQMQIDEIVTVIKILKGVNSRLLFNNPERFIFESIQVINESLVRDYVEQISCRLSDDKYCVSQFEKMVSHKDSVQDKNNNNL